MWQTLVTDAPREIGTTCLRSAPFGYQNAASQLPCWHDACRKLSTWAHIPCIHVLDCPVCPRTTPETTCLTPGSSGLRYKAPSGRLELFQILVGGGGPAQNIKRRFNMQMGISSGWARAPLSNSMPRVHATVRPYTQRSRLAKFAMHSSAGQKHGT